MTSIFHQGASRFGRGFGQKDSLAFALLLGLAVNGCQQDKHHLVIYTAHDQIYSEPVLKKFEQKTGIKVQAAYDTETTKTVGLVNRLIAERNNPQCDVFWNNEIVRTVMLKREGLLELCVSPSSQDIPAGMKDPQGEWAGFAARARVLIYNTNLLKQEDLPTSLLELTNARWKGKVAMAYPLFGTTATHASALFVTWGDDATRAYYHALKANNVVIVDGNSAVRDIVVRGEVPLGMTDTDDAYIAVHQGKPVRMVFPDQGEGQLGTLVIPNTVALIKGCPHPDAAKKFIDFLLSREAEEMLAKCGSAQMPVRPDVPTPADVPTLASIKAMPVDWEKVADKMDEVSRFLSELFVR